jgi:hypothetical protein
MLGSALRVRVAIASASMGALVAIGAWASMRSAEAEVVDPTTASAAWIGNGGEWTTDRGGPARNGRVVALPVTPTQRWSRSLGGRIDYAPLVAGDGGVIVVSSTSGTSGIETALYDLSPIDGKERVSTRIGDTVAAPPILLSSGARVVISVRGEAIGIDPSGSIRFRTTLGGDFSSVAKVGVVPLPGGGFSVARRADLVELDGEGNIAGRAKLEATPYLAALDDGETLAVTPSGELHVWRAGRIPRSIGTFGDKSIAAPVCRDGVVVDPGTPGATGRKPRALCVINESLVEAIDLSTGAKTALLSKPLLPFHTPAAVGLAGDVAIGGAGGTLLGLAPGGLEYGPIDLPGTVSIFGGKDGGLLLPTIGEFPPLVAADGAVLWGASEAIAIAHPGSPPMRVARCEGSFASTVAGVSSAGPSAIVVACVDGRVTLLADGAGSPIKTPKPPKPIPTSTTGTTGTTGATSASASASPAP